MDLLYLHYFLLNKILKVCFGQPFSSLNCEPFIHKALWIFVQSKSLLRFLFICKWFYVLFCADPTKSQFTSISVCINFWGVKTSARHCRSDTRLVKGL